MSTLKKIEIKCKKLLLKANPKIHTFINSKNEVENINVYFIDSELYEEFILLDLLYEAENENKKLNPFFSLRTKKISKHNNNTVYKIGDFKTKVISRTVTDKKKILNYLPAKFAIYRNIKRKELREYIDEYLSINPEAASSKISNLEYDLKIKEEELNKILADPKSVKLQISSYEEKEARPHIYCNFISDLDVKSRADVYLRSEVANMFLYNENIFEYDINFRPNGTVKAFEKKALNLFEDVYYEIKK